VVRWARKTHKRRQERAKWRQNKQISKQVERSRQWERVPREDDVHSLKARGTRTHTHTHTHKHSQAQAQAQQTHTCERRKRNAKAKVFGGGGRQKTSSTN